MTRTHSTRIAAACLAALLAGCGEPAQLLEPTRFSEVLSPTSPPAGPSGAPLPRDAVLDEFAPRPAYTYATIGGGDGVQVEYFAPDGRAFLWYPGQERVTPGEYRYEVEADAEGALRLDGIAFRYFERRRDGSVSGRDSGWDTQRIRAYQSDVVAVVRGDPFGLATRVEAPFRRTRCHLPEPMVAVKDTGGFLC